MTSFLKLLFCGWMMILMGMGCHFSENSEEASVWHTKEYRALTDSIHRFPDNPELYIRRALLFSTQGMHPAAEPDFQKAWELEPQPIYGSALAANLLDQQQYVRADKLLNKLAQQFPEESIFGRQLIQLYAATGKKNDALIMMDKMLVADSLNAVLWMDKGSLFLTFKDTLRGITCYEKAYQIQKDPSIGLSLAAVYQATLNPKVMDLCDEMLRNDKASLVMPDAAMLKGLYYSDKGLYPNAIAAFDQCIAYDWKMEDAHIEKGIVYFRMKNYKKALEIFKIVQTISSTNADARFWEGRCLESLGRTEEAIEAYQKSILLDTSLIESKEHIRSLEKKSHP